uniref:SCP domain-containing protein n=1 Tax=Macrostomum lignano TaxID=282301 RepID=A0A1I8JEG5_9PLAT
SDKIAHDASASGRMEEARLFSKYDMLKKNNHRIYNCNADCNKYKNCNSTQWIQNTCAMALEC